MIYLQEEIEVTFSTSFLVIFVGDAVGFEVLFKKAIL